MENSEKKFISVVIASYNRCGILKQTLDSLLSQKVNGNVRFEIVVADNNSNDDTRKVVENYQQNSEIPIKYLFESRQGKCYALNYGVEAAEGEIIAFTDDDCLPDPSWIDQIYKVFVKRNIELLAGRVIPIFEEKLPNWLDIEAFRGAYVNINMGDKYIENEDENITCAGANLIILKSSFKKYGGFDVNRRGQDVVFFYKWRKAGAKIGYAPNVIVYHSTPKSRMTKKYVRKWYFLAGQHHSIGMRSEQYQGRTFFRVPLWIYKKLFIRTFEYIKGVLFLNSNNFINEARMINSWGAVYGYFGFKKKYGDLR